MQRARLTEQLLNGSTLNKDSVQPMSIASNKESPSAICNRCRGGGKILGPHAIINWTWVLLVGAFVWATVVAFQVGRNGRSGDPRALALAGIQSSSSRWVQRDMKPWGTNSEAELEKNWSGDLRELEGAWNSLCFGKTEERMRMACFVKKWPTGGAPGGMERHAMTLYRDLAKRGHEIHVFTMNTNNDNVSEVEEGNLHVHLFQSTASGAAAENLWETFIVMNTTTPFDIVHTESVALAPRRALDIPQLAASWHGIAAEAIHSDIVNDLLRKPGELRSDELQQNLFGRMSRIVEEVKFFRSYKHHVAISDYVADVLRTIYEIPLRNVHTIYNGVDPNFQPNPDKGSRFRTKYQVPATAKLVFGTAGRLVRDKGHPLLFEAFSEVMKAHPDVYLLVAGSGPWLDRYKKLAPNVICLGPMPPSELTDFYNAIDVFMNPTLRSQGLDTTLLEAMQCGKPVLATRFSSITWSVIINSDFGYTFSPNVEAMVAAMEDVISQGRTSLEAKASTRQEYAKLMFTASKMGSAYERLFLCMKDDKYCMYPLPQDSCADIKHSLPANPAR